MSVARADRPDEAPPSRLSSGVLQLEMPALGPRWLSRPRLLAELDRGAGGGLTLVVAPAGYGKTSLLAEWTTTRNEPVAWVKLTPAQATVPAFVQALVSAVQSTVPDGDAADVPAPGDADPSPATAAANELARWLGALGTSLVLVLDDYHTLGSTPVHQVLHALLKVLPRNIQMVVASRIRPPLPLGMLRVRGHLVEIGPDALRFQQDEVEALFGAGAETVLPPAAIVAIGQRTAGWAVCLVLVHKALKEQAGPAAWAERFPHESHRHLDEFLQDEVIAPLPAELQELMLRTAVVDTLSAELCDALLGAALPSAGSQGILEDLALQSGLAESVDATGQWFCYLPPLLDLLRRRLRRRLPPGDLAGLHRRASAWLARAGRTDDAVSHALAAGEVTTAAELVESSVGRALEAGDFLSIERQLQCLPPELVASRPRLLLARAWLLQFHVRFEAIPAILERAEALLQEWETPCKRGLLAEIDTIRAIGALAIGDSQSMLTAARRACAMMPARPGYPLVWAQGALGLGHHLVGDTDEGIRYLEAMCDQAPDGTAIDREHALWGLSLIHLMAARPAAARQAAQQILTPPISRPFELAWGHFLHGLASYELNLLTEAREHFLAVMAFSESAHRVTVRGSLLGLMLLDLASDEADAALTTLKNLERHPDIAQNRLQLAVCRVFAARHAYLAGDLEGTASWLGGLGPTPIRPAQETMSFSPSLTRARLLIALGDETELIQAEDALDALEAAAASVNDSVQRIGVLAVRALLYQARGQIDTALQLVSAAVKDARPGGLVRTFVDLGPRMQTLLSELARRSPSADPYLTHLLAAFPIASGPVDQAMPSRHSPPVGPGLVEALTWRESDILQLLAERLSNKEIAASLLISPETVKKHTSNIYQKLMVGSRREAVTRAHALGLLPASPPPTRPGHASSMDYRTA